MFCCMPANFLLERFSGKLFLTVIYFSEEEMHKIMEGGSNLKNYERHCPCVGTGGTTKVSSSQQVSTMMGHSFTKLVDSNL